MGNRLKLLVSAVLVAVLFATVDMAGVLGHLLTIRPAYVLGTLAVFLLGQFVEACKLRLLLPDRPVGELFAFTLLVQLYALVLPGQIAGEAVKAYRLTRGRDDGGGIVSAVVFDKITSLIALLMLTAGGVLLEAGRFGEAMLEVVALVLAAFVAGTVLLAAGRPRALLMAALERAGRRWRWLVRLAEPLHRFLEVWQAHVRQPRIVVLSLLYGLAVQLLAVGAAYLLALGLGIVLTFPAWCVVFGVMSVVVLVPVTVGGLGLREASLVGLLAVLGVGQEPALALGLAIFAFKILVALLAAVLDVALLRERPYPET